MTCIVSVMASTSKQPIAEHLFDGDLEAFVRERRQAGDTWRDIELAVKGKLPPIITISYETLRTWYGSKETAA